MILSYYTGSGLYCGGREGTHECWHHPKLYLILAPIFTFRVTSGKLHKQWLTFFTCKMKVILRAKSWCKDQILCHLAWYLSYDCCWIRVILLFLSLKLDGYTNKWFSIQGNPFPFQGIWKCVGTVLLSQ